MVEKQILNLPVICLYNMFEPPDGEDLSGNRQLLQGYTTL